MDAGEDPGNRTQQRFDRSQNGPVERKHIVSMRECEQKRLKNSPSLPRLRASVGVLAMLSLGTATMGVHAQTGRDGLPDAPSALRSGSDSTGQNAQQPAPQNSPATTGVVPAQAGVDDPKGPVPPCPKRKHRRDFPLIFSPFTEPTCEDQLQLVVVTGYITPLTSKQKGLLAVRAVTDPFNLLTIATFSGISVAADSHSVYGPGFKGWGRLSGYSLAEDAQGDFTGVYVIPSLVHEDPRYHRMPKASVSRRIEHALIHTVVSQHDDGSLMPNYATLINVPLSAEISNLYVPDIGTNAPDTAKRVLLGYATDPIGPLIAEFLPDFAKRVHIRIIFAQRVLNRIALGSGEASP